jgi:flagellar biosynthesis/type III secretory pathway chaperone
MEKATQNLQATLVGLLQDEVARARGLLKSLKNENSALSNLDEKLVFINSANKQKLIESLQIASDARMGFMQRHKLSSKPAVIEEYTISSESNAELDMLFIQLSEIAEQCFRENRLIGQLINRRAQFITQTLASLSPSPHLQSLTYGETGASVEVHDGRNSLFYQTKI